MDLADISAQVLSLTVPRFADAAGVFVLERLAAGGGPGGTDGGRVVARRLGTRFADGAWLPDATFPAGEVLVFGAQSPYARCLRSGSPVTYERPDGQTLRHQRVAEVLQRGLLTTDPVQPAGIEVAGRCIPAGGLIGGDWYDIIPLTGDRTGLIVGDVMGHGIEAAATMAQLRAAAHALADLELPPGELLRRLDRITATLRDPVYATCVYAVIDPARRCATVALAGHLPPVLAMPDGTTHVPNMPADLSLGLGTANFGEARVRLPAGAILALFTDGLVETRTRSYDQGILAMRAMLGRQCDTLGDACDALVRSLGQDPEDDITLVLARIPADLPS
jgi:serine phosphatase RsbU (regulator of sigma subunit)